MSLLLTILTWAGWILLGVFLWVFVIARVARHFWKFPIPAAFIAIIDNPVRRKWIQKCLPEIPEPVRALKECKRILKDDGMVCLCELFIDPDYPLRRTEVKWAREAGLELKEQFGNWFAYQLHFGKQ